ncbi:T14N5.12 protein [Melia azedarach]|uniref:T14N5.12 protein n=1 Tax=Melia azedarach TaxID=155640 RepID=A0ACC1WPA5_MELAZ|nr:T14N5.12 protein [Melia azedarach]
MEIVRRIKNDGEEEADFAYDLRLGRRWKRRRIAYENRRINSCSNRGLKKRMYQNDKNDGALVTVDMDSEGFLNDTETVVGVDSDARCVDYADGNDCGDWGSNCLDPQYMMFLSYLNEDGKSYVLEHPLGDKRSIVVKYETEDGLNDELDVDNLETTKWCRNEKKIRTENILRNYADREKIGRRRGLICDIGGEKAENSKMVSRSNLGRERPKRGRRILRSNSGKQKIESLRVTFSSDSWTEKTERLKETLSKSNRKHDESPSIMHDAVKREKIESCSIMCDRVKREKNESRRTLKDNLRRENNERSSIMHVVVKREKNESRRTVKGNSRRENNESAIITHVAVKREKSEGRRTLKGNSRRENNESTSKMRVVAVKRKKNESRRTLRGNSRRKNIEIPRIMHDAVEREKTESQRALRSNPRKEKNESPSLVHDAVKREKTESRRSWRSNSRRENNESSSIMHDVVKREKAESARTQRNVFRRESMAVFEKNVDMEAEDPVSSAESGCSGRRHSPKDNTTLAKYKCNHGVCAPEAGKEAADEGSDSDSDVVLVENDPFSDGIYTPLVEVDGESGIEIFTGSKESHFRDKLMEFLQRPYDRMEYKRLSLEASCQRPLEEDKDLPRRRRLCGLDCNGKSYLDEFSGKLIYINDFLRSGW